MALIDNINDGFKQLATLIKGKVNKTDVIAVAQGGTGSNNVTTARSNLGLGTAATYTAGTSANNVLLLNNNGYVPQSALNGVYKNTTLDISNANIYRFSTNNGWESSATVYGLGEIRLGGNITGVIVIKTTVPATDATVVSINIDGLTDSETSTIKINILGYTGGSVSKFSYGSKDIPVRKATTPDGYLCFILGDVNTIIGTSTAISIISAHINFNISTNYLTNWSLYYTNDLTKYTNISNYMTQKPSILERNFYTNLANSSTEIAAKSIKSGSASYKKGWRKLTTTLPSQAGETTVAHGVTTVETVQAKVTASDGIVSYQNDPDPTRQFYIRVNGANLVLGVASTATAILGQPVTIYVGEEL